MTYYKYVVTAQKPTATHFAAKGPFTGPNDMNLVLGKGNRIEIYTVTPDGLKPTLECSIYGTIIALHVYVPTGRSQASLFLLTSRHKFCVLTYSVSLQQIVTEASSQVGLAAQPSELAAPFPQSVMHPSHTHVAALLYPSTITFIFPALAPPPPPMPVDSDGTQTVPSRKVSLRTHQQGKDRKRQQQDQQGPPLHYVHLCFPDKRIIAMTFVSATTMMVLYDNPLDQRYLQLYTYNDEKREMIPGDIVLDHIEQDATLLIPAGADGVLLISGQCIRYLKLNQPPIAIGISSSIIHCHAMINDDQRFFLGNAEGHLYLLVLNRQPFSGVVQSLGFVELGNISIPSCLVYLGNDVLYVGSSKGDSQVVHVLRRDSIENSDVLQIVENFPSLGPVTDFCVADLDKQGQPQLITCSGAGKDSSLRIIRSGVGLNQLAAIEMSGVKATWTLKSSSDQIHTDILVIAFLNETRLVQIQDNTIVSLPSYSALVLTERTLMAGNVANDMIVQVTDKCVRLMESRQNGILLDEWQPSQCQLLSPHGINIESATITVASLNPTQCVISIGYGFLIAFSIQGSRLVVAAETRLAEEIACLDITPIDTLSPAIAVGVWPNVICLLSFDRLALMAQEILTGMPRSILITRLEGICYLLVALGDGQVYNFKLDHQGHLWDKKRSFLGKLPIVLGTFSSNDMTHVFAACDKPTVIHSRNQKLVYSNVNLKEVRSVTSFHSPSFPDAVALTTREGIVIGQMEEIQKLHIIKIPTTDTPRRIIYQEASHTFGVITERMTSEPYTANSTTGGFEVLDDQNFIVLDRVYFKQYERPLAAISFEQDDQAYYAVATGKDSDTFETNSSGRILILQLQRTATSERKLTLMSQTRTAGMVEQLTFFKGKLVASVRGKLEIYEPKMNHHHTKLQLEILYSHQLPTITKSLTTHGDYIMAGDLISSVTVLKYDDTKQPATLEEVGADECIREVTCLEALSDTLALGAERDGHLFVVERALTTATTSLSSSSSASTTATSTLPMSSSSNNDHLSASLPSSSSPSLSPLPTSLEDPLLETVSEWHLGEIVQRFRFGHLGNTDPDIKFGSPSLPTSTTTATATTRLLSSSSSSSPHRPRNGSQSSLIFATANGAIGIIADLTEARFKLLWHMQNNMTKVVKSVGNLSHTDWRSVATMDRREESCHFIDGDLIESFLDLTPQQMQQVVDGQYGGKKLDHSIEDLCKVVEELMSLHS